MSKIDVDKTNPTKPSSAVPELKKDDSDNDEFTRFQASTVVSDNDVHNTQSPDGDLPSMDSFIGKSTPPMPTSNTGESEIGFGDFQASSAATGNVPSSQDVLPSMDSFTPSMSMMPNENNEASDTNLGKGFSEFQGSSMLMKSGENAENTQLTDDGLPAMDSFTKAMPMVSNGNANDSDKNFSDFQTPTCTTVPSDIGTTNIQSTVEGDLPSMDSFMKTTSTIPDLNKNESSDAYSDFYTSTVTTNTVEIKNVENTQTSDGDIPATDSFPKSMSKMSDGIDSNFNGESSGFQASNDIAKPVEDEQPVDNDGLPAMDSLFKAMPMKTSEKKDDSDFNEDFSSFQAPIPVIIPVKMVNQVSANVANDIQGISEGGLPSMDSFSKPVSTISDVNKDDSDDEFRGFQTSNAITESGGIADQSIGFGMATPPSALPSSSNFGVSQSTFTQNGNGLHSTYPNAT